MDFVAFDFETANSRADSACQLAAVKIIDSQIVQEAKWLVRPRRNYFSPRNISIHGIRPDDVACAPTMESVWPEFQTLIDGLPLIAHNALFDIGVLVASLAAWDIACPYLEFSCTRAIARRAWPGRARYGLKPLGCWLGVEFQHHDALEDSRCCARIALAAATTAAANSLEDLEKQLRLSRGRYSLGRATGPRALGGRSLLPVNKPMFDPAERQAVSDMTPATQPPLASPLATSRSNVHSHLHSTSTARPAFVRARPPGRGQIDPNAVVESSAGSLPLAGKRIVCLGTLRGLSLAETRQLIETLGGKLETNISADVHYVVACGGVLIGEASERVAEDAALLGDASPRTTSIRVLSERQFLALLPGGKAAVRW